MGLNLDQMRNTSGVTGINTNYQSTKKITLQYTKFGTAQINILASMLEIQLSNISSATQIYASITRDSAGDEFVMTETRADIQTGITTNTKGTASYRLDIIVRDVTDKVLYLHVRTNTGTTNVTAAALTYQY